MTPTRTDGERLRSRWLVGRGTAVAAALSVMAAAAHASATTPPDTSEPAASATSEVAAAPTTTALATATSEEFAAILAAECDGDTGEPLLAAALLDAAAPDGSLRLVEIFQGCDVEFVGEIDDEVGRPRTNVESLIADPVNNVTPNQAQIDALNAELAVYWKIADAWAQTQQAAAAPSEGGEAPTTPVESTAPATTISETATTG